MVGWAQTESLITTQVIVFKESSSSPVNCQSALKNNDLCSS